MEVGFGRQTGALAGQGRAAPGAKSAPRPSRGRVEFRDLPFRDPIRRVIERDEDGDRCSAVAATTLAVTPIDALRPTGGDQADGAAQAAAFERLGCFTHDQVLPLPPHSRRQRRGTSRMAPHSMTSSARARRDGGTAKARCLAVSACLSACSVTSPAAVTLAWSRALRLKIACRIGNGDGRVKLGPSKTRVPGTRPGTENPGAPPSRRHAGQRPALQRETSATRRRPCGRPRARPSAPGGRGGNPAARS